MSVEEGGKGACLWSGIGRTGQHGEGDGEKGGNDGCFSFSFFFYLFLFFFLFWSSNDRVVCPFLPAFPRSELRLPSCYRHYEGLHKRETGGGRLKAGQWKRQYLSFSAVLDWAVLFSLAECDWITHQPPVKMATVSA